MSKRDVGLRIAFMALAVSAAAAPLAACRPPPRPYHDHTMGTRTLAWPGGDRLFVATGADVRYVQGPAANVVITGPLDEIQDLVVDDGVIRRDRVHWGWRWWGWGWDWAPVHIVVTAPAIQEAGVSGSGHLDLGRLTQDRLDLSISGSGAIDASGQFKTLDLTVSGSGAARLDQVNVGDLSADLSGSGWIKASGAANSLHVGISGSGVADMGAVVAQSAEAHLSGSGSATLSPKQSADLEVFGSGAVRLLTEPPQLNAHRFGSGAILRPDGSRD